MLVIIFGLLFSATPAEASWASYIRGYFKPSTGTYVQPYYRSSPNATKLDNYSTKGNTNPFTGSKGYSDPYSTHKPFTSPSYSSPSYSSPYKSYSSPTSLYSSPSYTSPYSSFDSDWDY